MEKIIIKKGASGGARNGQGFETVWPRIERALASPLLRVIYLWGPPGCGKTWAAYNLGRLERGFAPVTQM
jgi:hypothetical protein